LEYDDSDSEGISIGAARAGNVLFLFFFATNNDDTIRFLATVTSTGASTAMTLAPSATRLSFFFPVDFPFRLFLAGVFFLCLPAFFFRPTGTFPPRRGDRLTVVFRVGGVMYCQYLKKMMLMTRKCEFPLLLYYDSRVGLCNFEINYQFKHLKAVLLKVDKAPLYMMTSLYMI
jgi:hypothetical protein